MRNVIVTGTPRPRTEDVAALAEFGTATVHEAQGRTGCLGPAFRPIQQGVGIAGAAVTALCPPGDNLMIHAAVEQCGDGDVLVVTTVSPSADGMFGELLATSLLSRGVRGLIIDAGVRDTAELRRLGFPVWSTAVCVQGTVKATAGAVNVEVVLGGQLIRPGDVIVADDDGVVVVERGAAGDVAELAASRTAKEQRTRAALAAGELGLDRYGLRSVLAELGVAYEPWKGGSG